MAVPTIACCMLKTISADMINLVNEESNERQPIGRDEFGAADNAHEQGPHLQS